MPTIINLEQVEILKTYGGQEMIKESFLIFIKEAKKAMQDCKISITNRNLVELFELAHRLKGGARTLGIVKLGDAAEKLESICKKKQSNQVDSSFESIELCFEEFIQNYQRILEL